MTPQRYSVTNIGIGDRHPKVYFTKLAEQCTGGRKTHGGITEVEEMCSNLRMSCLSESVIDG
ncbi:MAG: hypothetical protein EOS17_04220 [Mesorhizobium sp.]|nr:MAG: hypothetical protein EOS17_04220 [Mesorhizobium sp.]